MDGDYIRLCVAIDSTDKEIEKAYRKKAKDLHPDMNGGNKEDFQVLKESYDRIVKSRKQGGGLMGDSLLPMDYMGIGVHNRLNRLNRLNLKHMMDIEEEIMSNCNNFYSESTKIVNMNGKKKMEKTINRNGEITKEYYEM
jgi:hypothetical protein